MVKGQLTAKSHRCVVPGKMVRASSCKDKEGLTRGGSIMKPGDKVMATRPALSMDEALEVGMRVKVFKVHAGASASSQADRRDGRRRRGRRCLEI